MEELECMRMVDETLRSVEDDGARARVIAWLSAKYLGGNGSRPSAGTAVEAAYVTDERPNEIPGIAKLSQAGDVQLTVRDFKAKSANDAAVRLAHVVIAAAAKLTGESSVSSKNVIVPLLRKYRCYDGNTRSAIAGNKGLVRDGDLLSLDFHAEQYAEKVMAEIQDPTTEGKWKPGPSKRRTAQPARATSEAR
jgi:hypothetical protein